MPRHSPSNRLLLFAIGAAAASVGACAAGAGGPATASGSATVNGTRIPLAHVAAYSCPAIDDPTKTFVSILVSDKPVSDEAFRQRAQWGQGMSPMPLHVTGAWSALHRYDKAFEGIYFTVGPDGQISTDGILVGEVDAAVSLSGSGQLSADLKRDGGRVRGQIKTTRDVQSSGTTVALDVTLDAPVVALTKK
jgi:hypothetical protein